MKRSEFELQAIALMYTQRPGHDRLNSDEDYAMHCRIEAG